ncbi:MAG: cellulase family glycosylhydrolase [Eubacteriales bacterium]|nr:cellulase family glycosylhydrolase [Eubacteriales bacterium]
MNKFSRNRVKGFLHTDGRTMKNGDGQPVVLRGWGVGSWMNPEGFMIGGVPLFPEVGGFTDFALPRRFERGRTMESTVRELCGTAYAKEFAKKWYRTYLSEEDIRLMAEMGYNSVRLPVSARLFLAEEPGIQWIEEGFSVLEQVLAWCEKYRIYAILDLHGAPGGQSALACDDGLDNRPHMFTEAESRERAMILWEEFAKRYHDRWIIGGYDLLNEPLSGPDCRKWLPELARFYDELIPRIRKYDKNHMLTLEGSVFSMDLDIFDHEYDPECKNWCIHIHYYNFSPEVRDLYRFLDASLRCNVPVWIGEGGSDPVTNSIFYEIAAAYDIGYSVWSWKKADDPKGEGTAVVQYPLPEKWDVVREYIRNGGPRPSYAEAQEILDEMLEKMQMKYCRIDETYSRYNLRQPGIRIPAVGFDQGSAKGNGWIFGNAFGYRTEEGMKMPLRPGVKPPQRVVVPTGEPLRDANPIRDLCLELREGEAVSYTIRDVEGGCKAGLAARAAGTAGTPAQSAEAGASVQAEVSGTGVQPGTSAPAAGETSAVLRICCRSLDGREITAELSIASETREYTAALLSDSPEWVLTVTAASGAVQLDEVIFER